MGESHNPVPEESLWGGEVPLKELEGSEGNTSLLGRQPGTGEREATFGDKEAELTSSGEAKRSLFTTKGEPDGATTGEEKNPASPPSIGERVGAFSIHGTVELT